MALSRFYDSLKEAYIMRKLSLDNDLDESIWIEIRNILIIIQPRVS